MADEISTLINIGGQLKYTIYTADIMLNTVSYIVEVAKGSVIGCVGTEQKTVNTSELKHIAVSPFFRRKGTGYRLLTTAIRMATTDLLYGTVRMSNIGSMLNCIKSGMMPIGKYTSGSGVIIVFAIRRSNDGRIVQPGLHNSNTRTNWGEEE